MHFRAVISLSLLFAGAASPAMAADLPSADSLMQGFIDRSGGADAYAGIKNSQMEGTVEIIGRNIVGHVSIAEEGEKSWTAIDLPGVGRIEQGYDGNTAWEMSALQGPRILEGDEKGSMKRASTLALVNSWREEYKSWRTLGAEDVNGKPAWKIEMTPKEGKPEFFYFDKDSGLLVRMATVVSSPMGEIPAEVTISGYRPVDGIQTPFTMTQKALEQTLVIQFETVTYNKPLPKDRFVLPPEITALAAKRK